MGTDFDPLDVPIPEGAACYRAADSGAFVQCVRCADSVGARTSGWEDPDAPIVDGRIGEYGWPSAMREGLAFWYTVGEALAVGVGPCDSCGEDGWMIVG